MSSVFPDGIYTFTPRGGATFEAGKVYYPASLWLQMDRRDVLDAMQQMVSFLRGEEPLMELILSGSMRKTEQEQTK